MSRRHFAAHGRTPEYEDGTPFPVRIQTDADLAAMEEWRLLAVQDPFDKDGPISPFWADAPMLEGVGSATAPPLPPLPALLAEAGATLEGQGNRPAEWPGVGDEKVSLWCHRIRSLVAMRHNATDSNGHFPVARPLYAPAETT